MTEALERVAFAAWPAEEVWPLCGWQVRWMRGVTHRGNSAWTSEYAAGPALAERIEAVERFYAARGLPPSFHLSPCSARGLDQALAERGYKVEAPVLVQTAPIEALRFPSAAQVESTLGSRWFSLAGGQSRFKDCQTVYRGLLERLGARAVFALAHDEGRPAATALGVLDGAWLGVHSMLTQPEFRRRGHARQLLFALAGYAAALGVQRLYLLVEADNASAIDLYERAGFRTAHRTHYRVLSAG